MNAATDINQREKTHALTPTLSPKRGSSQSPILVLWSRSKKSAANIGLRLDTILPLPGGEGRGEGELSIETVQTKRKLTLNYELWFFAGLILLLNLPMLNGAWASAFAFHPDLVRQGEWWRVLTFPFVHVSIYHLLLDAVAFFLLYSGLRESKCFTRLAFVAASAFGSLLVSLFAAPQIFSVGLCGLSGIAHGLMAVSALEMMQTNNDKKIFWAGAISFLFVTGKAALEAITGEVVFSQLHFGTMGTPIAVCHTGGILGALAVALGKPTKAPFNSPDLCTSACS